LIRLKKAFRAAYRLRFVACFLPLDIWVRKERISSEEIEASCRSGKVVANLGRRNSYVTRVFFL
jgi:hypothetical protein